MPVVVHSISFSEKWQRKRALVFRKMAVMQNVFDVYALLPECKDLALKKAWDAKELETVKAKLGERIGFEIEVNPSKEGFVVVCNDDETGVKGVLEEYFSVRTVSQDAHKGESSSRGTNSDPQKKVVLIKMEIGAAFPDQQKASEAKKWIQSLIKDESVKRSVLSCAPMRGGRDLKIKCGDVRARCGFCVRSD